MYRILCSHDTAKLGSVFISHSLEIVFKSIRYRGYVDWNAFPNFFMASKTKKHQQFKH